MTAVTSRIIPSAAAQAKAATFAAERCTASIAPGTGPKCAAELSPA